MAYTNLSLLIQLPILWGLIFKFLVLVCSVSKGWYLEDKQWVFVDKTPKPRRPILKNSDPTNSKRSI